MAVVLVYITIDLCLGDYIKLSIMICTLIKNNCFEKSNLESDIKELKN